MALYNFQKRFVPMILSGDKRHTIRAKRKRATLPGETLHLYTGLRQKGARLLMLARCTKVEDIHIQDLHEEGIRIIVGGFVLTPDEAEQLARCDGFSNFAEMARFWDGRLPFEGDIIHWHFSPEGQHVERESSQARLSEAVSVSGVSKQGGRSRAVLQSEVPGGRLESSQRE